MEVIEREAQTTAPTVLVTGSTATVLVTGSTATVLVTGTMATALVTSTMATFPVTGSTATAHRPFRSRLAYRFGVPTTCWFST